MNPCTRKVLPLSGQWRHARPWSLIILILVALWGVPPAHGDTGTPQSFEIPAQPLSAALIQFSEATAMKLLFDADLARGQQSQGVTGMYSPEEALERLLAGTTLTYRFVDPQTITIVRAAETGATPTARSRQNDQNNAESAKTEPTPQAEDTIEIPEVVIREVKEQGYVADDTTTATKTDTPIVETPQSISVITRERMNTQEVNTLAEALRYTPGVQAEPFGFEPRFTFLRFRGFDITTNGLYRDGLQLRNPGFRISYNLEPYGAQRFEVLRGPSSVLYGQASPGGLVNYVSKRPTLTPLRELQFLAGSFDRYEGRFDVSGPVSEDSPSLAYRLTGLFRGSDTQIDFVDNDRVFVAPALTWRPGENTSFTLLGQFQKDGLGSSQALPAEGTLRFNPNGSIPASRFTGQPGVDDLDRNEFSIGYLLEHHLANWTFRQNFRYNSTEVDELTVFSTAFGADKRTVFRSAFGSFGDLDAVAIDTQAEVDFTTGPAAHTVLGGVDFQRITVGSVQTFAAASSIDIFDPDDFGAPIPEPPIFSDTDTVQWQTGVYLQDQIKFFDKFIVSLAGRHDWAENETENNLVDTKAEQTASKFSGRGGLIYRSDIGAAPYFSASTSFLPAIGTDPEGNPFDPETARQFEIGLRYQPPQSNSYINLALFDLKRKNFLQTDPATFLQVQTGEARSRGFELEALASLDMGLDVIATYTLMDVEITESVDPDQEGDRPAQTPEQFASVWAKYTVPEGPLNGVGVGGGFRYTGDTFSDLPNTFNVPDFVMVDAVVDYTWQQFRFAVNVTNLLDEEGFSCFARGADNFCVFGEQRNVVGSIVYRW